MVIIRKRHFEEDGATQGEFWDDHRLQRSQGKGE
jgi:hypothetical protein